MISENTHFYMDYLDMLDNLCYPVSAVQSMAVDDELFKCLHFKNDNAKGIKFTDYLSKNKILIDDVLFEKYTNIFISQNYICSDSTYTINTSDRFRLLQIEDTRINTYVTIVKNNGFIPTISDLLQYPTLLARFGPIDIPKEFEDSVRYFLYRNISTISRYNHIVSALNDHDLCVIYEIYSCVQAPTQTILKALYTKYHNSKPNKIHLMLSMRKVDCKIAPARSIINFFVSRGVECEEYLLHYSTRLLTNIATSKLNRVIDEGYNCGLFIGSDKNKMDKKGTKMSANTKKIKSKVLQKKAQRKIAYSSDSDSNSDNSYPKPQRKTDYSKPQRKTDYSSDSGSDIK